MIDKAFPEKTSGAEADTTRCRNAVCQSVVEAEVGIVKPDASERTPVEGAYERPVADEEIAARARALVKYGFEPSMRSM